MAHRVLITSLLLCFSVWQIQSAVSAPGLGGQCLEESCADLETLTCDSATSACICNSGNGYSEVLGQCMQDGLLGGICLSTDQDAQCMAKDLVCNKELIPPICACAPGLTDVEGVCTIATTTSAETTTASTSTTTTPITTPTLVTGVPLGADCLSANTESPDRNVCADTNAVCSTETNTCQCIDTHFDDLQPTDRMCRPISELALDDCRRPTITCSNGGTCPQNPEIVDLYKCVCATGFSGPGCGTEDLCVTKPCPTAAIDCVETTEGDGGKSRVCICPDSFKGPECSEDDVLVECEDRKKFLYFDQGAPDGQRTLCLKKTNTVSSNVCYDPIESLVYNSTVDKDVVTFTDDVDNFCLKYIATTRPVQDQYCFQVTASEADDVVYRPWRSLTFDICYVFNRQPFFHGSIRFSFNVPTMEPLENIPLNATDFDEHQTLRYTLAAAVIPQDMTDVFSIGADVLQVNKPTSITIYPITINVDVQVEDSGIPALNNMQAYSVTFTNASLVCDSSDAQFLVHFESGQASQVELGSIKCSGATGMETSFQVEGGPVTVDGTGNIRFDPEAEVYEGTFQVDVVVQAFGDLPLQTTASFEVIAGDLRPTCTLNSKTGVVEFLETAPMGFCSDIAIYTCSQPAPLVISICQENSNLFDLNCSNAETAATSTDVFACAQQDLTNAVRTYNGIISVGNKFGVASVPFEVIVTNVNDAPSFLSVPTSHLIPEHMKVDSVIFSVTVSDPDLSLDLPTPETLDVFIEPTPTPFYVTLNGTIVEVRLSEKLDVAVQSQYLFTITVRDSGGLTATLAGDIYIEDENDPPTCTELFITATLSVKDPAMTVFATLDCLDPDINPQFKQLTYAIQGATEVLAYFAVNASGVVSLQKGLYDLPNLSSGITLTVNVTDGGGLSVPVDVEITIGANVPPTCQPNVITLSKSEDIGTNVCFSVNTSCMDPVHEETLTYAINSGNGTDLFREYPEGHTTSSIGLCTITDLIHWVGLWELIGHANSTFGSTEIFIQININDINEPPILTNVPTITAVTEGSPVGKVLFTLRAEDPDTGSFGTVTFHSEGADGIDESPWFLLDLISGNISVKAPLDYETMPSTQFNFTIQAIDGGQINALTATAVLKVVVNDINDNSPVCLPLPDSITIDLLANIGDKVVQLDCTDADKSLPYRTIEYSIDSGSSPFVVDENGRITVAEVPLSRNISTYSILVSASNPNSERQSVVQISIDVAIPPVCDPLMITKTVPETQAQNACLDVEVKCTDPTGRIVTLTGSSGNGAELMAIRTHTSSSGLGLNACTKTSMKNRLGQYVISAVVTNGLAETTITWNFNVANVNEAPVFMNGSNVVQKYEASIAETVVTSATIMVLTVYDPDVNQGILDFEVTDVTAELINNGTNEMSILFNERTFFNIGTQNATLRNLFIFRVTATDGMGLFAQATVSIHIEDVNSVPVCTDGLGFRIDILLPPASDIAPVLCYDTDDDVNNRLLQYAITAGDPDGYFGISALEGMISVHRKLPRLPLYQRGVASLTIEVSDGGSPSLTSTVTVDVHVDNKIPPTCSHSVTPPDVWVLDSCLTINMECTDPTMDGVDHLTFGLSGNYTEGFSNTNSAGGMITLCYTRRESGVFQIYVLVGNGLNNTSYEEVIDVKYAQATPKFSLPLYEAQVPEKTLSGTVIITVRANSSQLIGTIDYSVVPSEGIINLSKYLTLDSNTGVISTVSSLKELANQMMSFKVKAEDTASKLSSMANVEIMVVDLNEPPVCGILTVNVNIAVSTPVDYEIVTFECSDPDVISAFQDMNFAISGKLESTYFKLNNPTGNPTAISVRVPLEVNTETYAISLVVSDSGTPPLQTEMTFQVTIDLLPPPLILEVTVLYNWVNVQWSYDRDAFYTVTDSYIVVWGQVDGNIPSMTHNNTVRSFNITDVSVETTYNIYVQAITTYGSRKSATTTIKTPEAPVVDRFTVTLHILGIEFSPLLRDPDSFRYVEEKRNFLDNMMAILKPTLGFHSIDFLGFREANSVYADFVITVNQSGSVEGTKDVLQKATSSGWINTLSVNSSYFITSSQRGYVMVEEIAQSPLNVSNGNDTELVLMCKILAIGYLETEEFTYWWTYNNKVIQPTSNSRFSLNSSTLSFPQEKESSLRLKPVRLYDSGSYACFVAHKASGVEAGRNITVTIISQPVVTLTPASKTLNESTNVNLTCVVIRPLDGQFDFHWYLNGQLLKSREGAEIVEINTTSTQLMITAITATTEFGCEANNTAGIIGPRAVSYIGVIPTKVAQEKPTVCKESLDYRRNAWPIAAVSTIAVQGCPPQTAGTVTRKCKDNGEWSSATYDCVQQTIRDIQQQISQAQDGLGSANVTSSLGELANATDTEDLLEGDMSAVVDVLKSVADVADEINTTAGESETETLNFLEVASNLLNKQHKGAWNADINHGQPGAINVAQVVETYIKAKVKQLSSSTTGTFMKNYTHKNIYAEIGRRNESDSSAYTFPNSEVGLPPWMRDTKTGLSLSAKSFNGMSSKEYSCQVFRNLPGIVAKKLKINGQVVDSGSMDINSDVTIAFQSQQPVTNLDPPALVTFQHSSPNYSRPICVFWDFGETIWSSDGCALVSTSDTHTVCSCNHFTNFAVLMSPGKTPASDLLALSIISAIGCGISLFCLVLTVGAHLRVWRLVKSARATLLMHLCVSLILAYVVFLAGINRTENEYVCTAIAALLHYLWLVVFFLMLAEGIEIAVSVIYVFVTKSRVKWLVPLAWGVPAIIVGISLGVSRLEGYGTDTFCWLSTEDGLLWAFVGPAAFVILVNFIIIITVFKKMFKSSAMLTKTDKEKAKTGVRSLCVLLPVLGLSWVFGIFSVNEDLVAFQYIFAICNALQGFFIFLFHCLLNRQLKEAWKQTRIRKKSLASFEDSYKKQTSSVTASTTYYSPDGSTKQSNDEQVSNPFLEADRQMQEYAKRDKKGGANIFNKTPNNKLDKDKDKPNVDVALEDVKISNILRESEVMGEAAGISSILNTPDRPPESGRSLTRTEEGHGISRETQLSSRKYDYIDTNRMETFGTPQPKPAGYEKLLSPQRPSQSRPYTNLHDDRDIDQDSAGRVTRRVTRRDGERPHSYELDTQGEVRDPVYTRGGVREPVHDYEASPRQNERGMPRGYAPDSRRDDRRGSREELNYNKGSGKSSDKHSRSSRSDDDIEGRHRSQDISEAMPTRYKPKQMKMKPQQVEPTRPASKITFGKVKDAAQAKKKSQKDRSQVYQYPYDVNYLGPQSRHSSLENMSSQYGYSPYAGMHSGPGHSASRPARQLPQWDQYGQYGRTRPQQRRGDYW